MLPLQEAAGFRLQDAAAGGFVRVMSDEPGVIRPSLPVEAAEGRGGRRLRRVLAFGLTEAAVMWLRVAAVPILLSPLLLLVLLLAG